MSCLAQESTLLGLGGSQLQRKGRVQCQRVIPRLHQVVAVTARPNFQQFCGLHKSLPLNRHKKTRSPQSCRRPVAKAVVSQLSVATKERQHGAHSVIGSARVQLEDTYSTQTDQSSGITFYGVFDGHGGNAVAEFLRDNTWKVYKSLLKGPDLRKATEKAYLDVDAMVTAQPKGLFGALRERGLGGAKCGACAATAVLLPGPEGSTTLVAANVGDARVLLGRGGETLQLTIDHKPNLEAERRRIEAKNPTPRKPLVVNVNGTWRVGGLLALSRAFGDVYLKDWQSGEASGGFGLTAEPDVIIETLTPDDDWLILATDGLTEVVPNEEIVSIVRAAGSDANLNEVARKLVALAQERGSDDDITVVVVPLE